MKVLLCTPAFNGGNTLMALHELILNSTKNIPVEVFG